MANISISQAALTSPLGTDLVPIARPGDVTARSATLLSIVDLLLPIPNSSLANSSITINGNTVSLGGSTTVTANTPYSLSAGTGLTGGSFNGGSAVSLSLANTGVSAGSYGGATSVPVLTINAQGQITSASTVSIGGGTVTNVSTGTGLTGGPITTSGTISIANTGVTAASYSLANLTVNAQGQITSASSATTTGTGAVVLATSPSLVTPNLGTPSAINLANGTNLAVGGISATGTPSSTTYLRGDGSWATVSSNPGTVTSVNASGDSTGLTFTGGPITTSGTLTLGGTLGTGFGGTGLSATPTNGQLLIGNGTGYTLATLTQGTGLSISNGSGSISLNLANTTVTAASYGSSTQVGTFTVNAQGQLTAAGNTTVTPAVGSITGLGTGVATALAVNTGTSGAFVVNGGALGTPSSGTATNLTGLPVGGISATGTPSSTTYLCGNGTWSTISTGLTVGTTATSGGAAGQIMFDTGSVLQESSGLTWDNTNKALTLGGGTATASNPVINASQTWNNSSTTFTGLKLNVTNTASASGSKLLDLQVGGSSIASISSAGALTFPSGGIILGGYGTNLIKLDNANQTIIANVSGAQSWIYYATGVVQNGSIGFASGNYGTSPDVFINRDGSGAFAQVNGTNSQSLRVYNTSSSSNANYERGVFDWQTTSNTLTIGTQNAGTGVARYVKVSSATNVVQYNTTTVASLPSASAAGVGARSFVTDGLAPVWGTAVTGGGTVPTPVYSTGSAWYVG